MPFISQNLKLPFIASAQAKKHVTHNEALRALDAIVQLSLVSKNTTMPPASPIEGSRYFVATNATDAWINHDGLIAAYQDGAWAFYTPNKGWQAWIEDENSLQIWDGSAWQSATLEHTLQNIEHVGVNTTADPTNRLSVSSPATLLNHDGNGHQLKINKNTSSDTASLLYQTNWSGRAEIGLAGDDNFHFKVSPDGSTFHEGLIINRNNGVLDAPNGLTVFGNEIHQAPVSSGVGKRVFLGKKTNIGYDKGTPLRTVRYSIEIEGFEHANGNVSMYLINISGYAYVGAHIIDVSYAGYSYNGAHVSLNSLDNNGGMEAIGQYISSNGKVTLWFETKNYYTTFIVESVRVGNGDNFGTVEDGITTTVTETGIEV